MKPILQIEIELTPEQVKKMEGATKVLTRMSEKKKPGAFLAQIFYTDVEFNSINRAMNYTPRIKCYVIPNYLYKRLIRIIDRASKPANKIPRRDHWKAAATGILKYIKNSKVKRTPKPQINEDYDRKFYQYDKKVEDREDDIPF
ncbi:MAG: hypothetical protein PVG39_00420 [Desulfobacteraceae bacterium]|jgi:hypothetical protein